MNQIIPYYLDCSSILTASSVIPVFALVLSIIALLVNRSNSLKGIRLSIQQSIIKTISEKAKDCNSIWENESDRKFKYAENTKILSELIITIEIIEKTFELYSKNDDEILELKDEFYWLFWKQLRTDLRGWIKRTPEIVAQKDPVDIYYSNQVADLYKKFEKHFEPVL